MRRDVQQTLEALNPKDAKQLSKRHYQESFETVPEAEEIIAAIPAMSDKSPGPLMVTTAALRFAGRYGNQLAVAHGDIHGSRYTTSGLFNPKPYMLYVLAGGGELQFVVLGATKDGVDFLIEALSRAKSVVGSRQSDARQPLAGGASAQVPSSAPSGPLQARVREAVGQYRAWLDAGDRQAIVAHRNELEQELATSGADPTFRASLGANWFWVNALPALAGLELDQQLPVFGYANAASDAVDLGRPEQVLTSDTIDMLTREQLSRGQ